MNAKTSLHITMDEELAMAMEDPQEDYTPYLDVNNNELVWISNVLRDEWDEMDNDQWETILKKANNEEPLTTYEEDLLKIYDVESKHEENYLLVETIPHWTGYEDMKAFIDGIEDMQLREKLERSIQGKGAFRRFKDAIGRRSGLEKTWFRFKRNQQRTRIAAWLAKNGVSCTFNDL